MKVEVSKQPNSQVKMKVTIEKEDFQKYEALALKSLGEKISIKGFRKGHVPINVIKEKVGESALKAETIDIALPQTYADAVVQEKLEVISRPTVTFQEPKEGDEEIVYEAVVAVMPEVKLGKVADIKVKEEKVEVTDEDVNKVLEDVKKRNTTYEDGTDDAVIENGDRVELDFEGFDEGGAALEGTASKNHPVVIGSNSFVPGFEENVLGLKKNEKKEFVITFPADYFQKSFQNKKVKFNVEVKLIQKAKSPEFTPEFIKSLSGKEMTLEEMKKEITEGLKDQKKVEEKKRREVEFLDALEKITSLEIAPQLIEDEIDFMIHDLKHDLESKGLNYQSYLDYLKKTEEEHRKEYEDEAKKRITLRFGLKKLYEDEKIEVSDQELADAVEEVISYYPDNHKEEIRKRYAKKEGSEIKQLINRIKLDKVLKKYLS